MRPPQNNLTTHVYNISSFSCSTNEFHLKILEYYSEFKMYYKIDYNKQKIVNSWPNNINDQKARKDWKWEPLYNFNKAYKHYLIPKIIKKYKFATIDE